MGGIPTKYTPEIGTLILDKMRQGYSLVAAASFADVGRTTVYDWLERYPEFKRLYHLAQAYRQAHWEEEALTTTSAARVTMITKALGGMRSPDWSEDKRLEIDVNHNHNHTLQIADLTTEQLASLAAMLAPKEASPLTIDHDEDD